MRSLLLSLLTFAFWTVAPAWSQDIIRQGDGESPFQPLMGDRAVLDAGEQRDDLRCSVKPQDPKLEFDLNFRSGYVTRIPLAELAGSGDKLRVLFRVESLDGEMEPVWFKDEFEVPAIDSDAKGQATLPGKYRLGPGRYKVSWLMRDRAERVCASSWEVEARDIDPLSGLAAAPDAPQADEVSEEIFVEEPPIRRARGKLLHAKLIVSFTPMDVAKVKLSDYDMRSVVSMLRAINRQPQIGTFSLVAYQAHQETVLFEQTEATRIDYPALGEAIDSHVGGTVNLEQLQDKRSGEKFLEQLLTEHLPLDGAGADIVIFAGPKVIFERQPGDLIKKDPQRPQPPMHYFIYNRNPRSYPWKDALSDGLGDFSVTTREITSASDFGRAMQDLVKDLERLQDPRS